LRDIDIHNWQLGSQMVAMEDLLFVNEN